VLKRSSNPTVPKQLIIFSSLHSGRPTEKCIYSVAILVKDDAEVGTVGTVGAFSTYRRNDVNLVNNTTLTGQSCFGNLSRVTYEYKLPAAATNQTPQEKSNKKQHMERVFADAALNIVKPTAIYAVLKFKEVLATCSTDLTSLIRSQP
jgi:hypothetical protein